jgi:hypothetical protein
MKATSPMCSFTCRTHLLSGKHVIEIDVEVPKADPPQAVPV